MASAAGKILDNPALELLVSANQLNRGDRNHLVGLAVEDAGKVIEKISGVTDKPIKYVVLSHYHAVRVLDASAHGASEIIMSDEARAMVAERGQEDWDSELGRFPRLFQGHESIPGLTWPTLTFDDGLTFCFGKRRVGLKFLGRANTAGDIVAHVPDANAMFTGDMVRFCVAWTCS